jgi:hypothetical protein
MHPVAAVALWLFRRLRGAPGAVARPILDPLHRPLHGLSHTVYSINTRVQPPGRRAFARVLARGGLLRLLLARLRDRGARRRELQQRLAELPESGTLVYVQKYYDHPDVLTKRPVAFPLVRQRRQFFVDLNGEAATVLERGEPLSRVMGAHYGDRDVTRRFRGVLVRDLAGMCKVDLLSFLRIGLQAARGRGQAAQGQGLDRDQDRVLRIMDSDTVNYAWP